jgi:hypothetical protein
VCLCVCVIVRDLWVFVCVMVCVFVWVIVHDLCVFVCDCDCAWFVSGCVCVIVCFVSDYVWFVCDLTTSTVSGSRPEFVCSATKNGGKTGIRYMPKNDFLCWVLFSWRKLALITSPVGHLEVIPGGCSEVPHKEVFTLFLLLFFCIFILSSPFPSY